MLTHWRTRLVRNFKDPVVCGQVMALMGGKLIGLTLVLAAMRVFVAPAVYADAGQPTPEINAINTVWTLIAAFLVFGMQVGFVMLEAGFAAIARVGQHPRRRHRRYVHLRRHLLGRGASPSCSRTATASSARTGSSCKGLPDTYGTTGVPLLAFWVFQFAFADTCSTITSGAMVGRCGFVGDILYSIGVTGFIYPIIGHWAWGPDGWLAVMRRRSATSRARRSSTRIGGAISLAGAIALGPRLGRVFRRDGGGPMPPHNLILGAVGGLILWFGWYGFNPGSTLSALDVQGIGRVSFNTTMAACSAGLTALFYRLRPRRQVGPRPHRQRLPRRPRRDHLPVLLGESDGRVLHRHRRAASS